MFRGNIKWATFSTQKKNKTNVESNTISITNSMFLSRVVKKKNLIRKMDDRPSSKDDMRLLVGANIFATLLRANKRRRVSPCLVSGPECQTEARTGLGLGLAYHRFSSARLRILPETWTPGPPPSWRSIVLRPRWIEPDGPFLFARAERP